MSLKSNHVDTDAAPDLGVFTYENWRTALSGSSARDTLEYPLYSDAHIIGEITEGLGPYQLLNCIADVPPDPNRPVLALRISYHMDWRYGHMDATDTTRYHGGDSSDEIAALVSLCLGVRMKAGGTSRWFKLVDDPRGRPWSFRQRGRPEPTIIRSGVDLVLPRARDEHHIGPVSRLTRFYEVYTFGGQ